MNGRGERPAPLRLTRRGRVVVVVFVALMLTLAGSLARVASSASGPPPPPRTHVVAPGESLWEIALRWHPGADPRVGVARLVAVNHLASPSLVPGQALHLP
jgi:hypothetical protein